MKKISLFEIIKMNKVPCLNLINSATGYKSANLIGTRSSDGIENVAGMSQYSDGGILATKPYVSTGSYINKMSNYCGSCQYNVKEKLGENACPFNSLYWHFLDEKKQHFSNNQRMSMMLTLLRKMKPEELAATKEKAISILESIENL